MPLPLRRSESTVTNPDLPSGNGYNETPQPPQAPQPPQYQPAPQYQQAPQYQPAYAQAGVYAQPGPGEPFDGAVSADDLSRPLYGASFGQAIRRFFKNYVNFKGRASRSEYWWTQLFLALIMLVPFIVYIVGLFLTLGGIAAGSTYDSSTGEYVAGADAVAGSGVVVLVIGVILMAAIWLGTLLPSLGLVWRRLHDANFAGPFYFLSLTSIGSIVVLVFTILGPKPEGRRFDQ